MNVRQLMEALGWDRVSDGDLFKRQVLTELLERRAKDAEVEALRAEWLEFRKLLGKA